MLSRVFLLSLIVSCIQINNILSIKQKATEEKKQIFKCGAQTFSVNCEKQGTDWFVKNSEFEDAIITCNNTYKKQLAIGTPTNCKLSREKDEEFQATNCNEKKQYFHCVKKDGQTISLDAPCETISGKCYVKQADFDELKNTCGPEEEKTTYTGEFRLSPVQVCKLPDER